MCGVTGWCDVIGAAAYLVAADRLHDAILEKMRRHRLICHLYHTVGGHATRCPLLGILHAPRAVSFKADTRLVACGALHSLER